MDSGPLFEQSLGRTLHWKRVLIFSHMLWFVFSIQSSNYGTTVCTTAAVRVIIFSTRIQSTISFCSMYRDTVFCFKTISHFYEFFFRQELC